MSFLFVQVFYQVLSYKEEAIFVVFQKVFIEYVKGTNLLIKTIHYFSDGAASQYKNKKNMANLCYHDQEFGLQADWNFFATAHGKSPCDGAGGTIKRIIRKASLPRTAESHILTPQAMFDFCTQRIPGIKFFFVPKADVEASESRLTERFENLLTIKHTRSYHHFERLSSDTLKARKYSAAESFEVVKVKMQVSQRKR